MLTGCICDVTARSSSTVCPTDSCCRSVHFHGKSHHSLSSDPEYTCSQPCTLLRWHLLHLHLQAAHSIACNQSWHHDECGVLSTSTIEFAQDTEDGAQPPQGVTTDGDLSHLQGGLPGWNYTVHCSNPAPSTQHIQVTATQLHMLDFTLRIFQSATGNDWSKMYVITWYVKTASVHMLLHRYGACALKQRRSCTC